jgi:hypothetical protein
LEKALGLRGRQLEIMQRSLNLVTALDEARERPWRTNWVRVAVVLAATVAVVGDPREISYADWTIGTSPCVGRACRKSSCHNPVAGKNA